MVSELLFGLAGVLIGAVVGHRLAIGRDKRREFNERVQPIQESVLKAIDGIRRGEAWVPWNSEDLYAVKAFLGERKRQKLDILIRSYQEASKAAHKPDGMGGSVIVKENLPEVQKALENIRYFLRPK